MIEKLKSNLKPLVKEVKKEAEEEIRNKDDIEEDDEDYYKFYDYDNEDLKHLTTDELKKRKEEMERLYSKNAILPGDQNFKYDIRVNIN